MRRARVGASGPQATRIVKRLRALSPAWSVSRREGRWIAEEQAKLLLNEAGIAGPPVPEQIVSDLAGVNIYPLAQIPSRASSAPASQAAAEATS